MISFQQKNRSAWNAIVNWMEIQKMKKIHVIDSLLSVFHIFLGGKPQFMVGN